MRKALVAVAAFTSAIFGAVVPASATFHIIVIDQMFPGFAQAPGAQYVVLRMEDPLQIAVYGQPVPSFDAIGNPRAPFATFCSSRSACSLPNASPACTAGDCPNAFDANNSRVFVATRWAQDLFCVTADLLATGSLSYPDGRVCWGDCSLRTDCGDGPVDCLAYGSYTGDNGVFGTPAASPMLGQALVASPDRKNQFLLGGNLLDDSKGFSIGTPAPQNYHGDVGGLDGLAGDSVGSGRLDAGDVDAEVSVLFEADRRCTLPAARRGADANLDTHVNAADVVATIQIVSRAS
jgi:hypothetical protein